MADISNEVLYEELLDLDVRLQRLVEQMEETVAFARETNRILEAGQARNDALKKRLFGDRLDRLGLTR